MNKLGRSRTRWAIFCLLVAVAAVALSGCGGSFLGIESPFGKGGTPSPPAIPQQTSNLIHFMAVVPFMLGLAALIAALWFPILQAFRRMAFGLIALGITLAILPWVLDISALPVRIALWAALAFGIVWAAALTWAKIGPMLRLREMNHKLSNGATEEEKVKLASGISTLTRTLIPKVDRAFKSGVMTTKKLINEGIPK